MARCSWLGSWGRRLSAPLEVRQASLPLARYHKIHEEAGQNATTGVGFGSGVCIAINLVMGSGFLALPKAFVSTGLVLGTVVLFVSMALLSMTAGYEMEVMCRADAWVKANLMPLMHKQCSQEEKGGTHLIRSETMCLGNHVYQVSEMCEIFGGRTLQRVYNVLLFFYVFCALWGFAAIFGEAFATYAPLPFLGYIGAYRLYVTVFSAVMVPMSCLNIKEQALFQVVLTAFRFIALFTMVGSIIASLHMGEHPFGPTSGQFIGTVELFRWRGFFQAIPPSIFALSLASTVPTLASGLEDKHSVRMVTWTALISAAVTYTSFSLATAYYFGVSVDGSCNVNWEHYRPGDGGSGSPFLVVLGRVVAYFVVFFPALDVMSVYPLDVMVVANNMMVMVYNDHVDNAHTDTVVVTTFRVACAVPPLLCALLIRNFSEIVNYGGSLTIMIALVIPAYLNLISKKQCEERFGTSRTAFTGDISSSTPALRACILLGAVLFITLALNDVASLLSS